MDGKGVGVGVGRTGEEGEMQATAILIEGDSARADQLHALDWPREGGGSPARVLMSSLPSLGQTKAKA